MGKNREKKRLRKNKRTSVQGRSLKIRGTPDPLVQGAADSGKQRLVEQFRDASAGEQRSNYGGDQIEDTALYTERTAARGAEAFVRSRMADLVAARRGAAEPPLYDLPFDLTDPPKPGASAEPVPTTAASPPELPPSSPGEAVTPGEITFPTEIPQSPDGPISLDSPIHPELSAFPTPSQPLELPAPETPVEPSTPMELPAPTATEPPTEPAEKPARRRTRSEPQVIPEEAKGDSWTPAYRDAQPEKRQSQAAKKPDEITPDASARETGERTGTRNKDKSRSRRTDRKRKSPKGRSGLSTGEQRTVKTKRQTPADRQSRSMEPGRQGELARALNDA